MVWIGNEKDCVKKGVTGFYVEFRADVLKLLEFWIAGAIFLEFWMCI